MDHRIAANLDAYITGGRAHREEQTLTCPSCGAIWDKMGWTEYGQWSPEDGEWSCPDCDGVGDLP